MKSCELVTFISTLACAIAKGKTVQELNLLSVIFSQLGDSLATLAVTQDIIESNDNSNSNSNTDTKLTNSC